MSYKGVQATVTSRAVASSGVTTITGIVTDADAMEFCTRDPGGDRTGAVDDLANCAKAIRAREKDQIYVLRVSCAEGKLIPHLPDVDSRDSDLAMYDHWWWRAVADGETDYIHGIGDVDGPAWQDTETGDVVSGTPAGTWMSDLYNWACSGESLD